METGPVGSEVSEARPREAESWQEGPLLHHGWQGLQAPGVWTHLQGRGPQLPFPGQWPSSPSSLRWSCCAHLSRCLTPGLAWLHQGDPTVQFPGETRRIHELGGVESEGPG